MNLLFLVKTGFGKSIIYQLLSFIIVILRIVLILLLFKLLLMEQNKMINQLPNKKVLVLNDKSNYKYVHKQAIKRSYTHIFISSEIALSKKFKKNIFNDPAFFDWLCLLAVDKIYLID